MASGDTLVVFTPLHNEPPSASAATLDTRNQHPVLDFDASTNEQGVFGGLMPQHYSGTTGVTVFIHYSMSTATSACTDWDVSFELIGSEDQDLDSDGFAAVNAITDHPVSGSSGFVVSASVAFTDGADMDSVAAGDPFRLKVVRKGTTDGATGDAELTKVEIRDT